MSRSGYDVMIVKWKSVISPEVFMVVMGVDSVWGHGVVDGGVIETPTGQIIDKTTTVWYGPINAEISVFELMYRCKEWVYKTTGHSIKSYLEYNQGHATFDYDGSEWFNRDTEWAAVFAATEFVYNKPGDNV